MSYARPEQIKKILKVAKSVVVDNGAFSVWKKAKKHSEVVDWDKHWASYYCFIMRYYSQIDWFIIPDVIEGTEQENDLLINSVPSTLRDKAVPVWHSVESIERFVSLCERFDRVAIGLCGEHSSTRSKKAQERLTEAFKAIYVERDIDVKIHGLRMLDGRVLGKFPLDSGDSTSVAINVPKDKLRFPEVKGKLARTAVLRAAIEKVSPPTIEEWQSQHGKVKKRMNTEYKSHTPHIIKDSWQTPIEVFDYYNAIFNFTNDVAASDENYLVDNYFTMKDNALKQDWGDVNWCNPPYSHTHLWVEKAIEQRYKGSTTVMLIPADTSTKWFEKAFANASKVEFITGRLSFINAHTKKPVVGNNKGSVVFIFTPNELDEMPIVNLVNRDDIYSDFDFLN